MAASSSLDAFHLFPRLPTELRLQIWKFAAVLPRVLTVRSVFSNLSLQPKRLEYFYSPDPAPAMFLACQESRLEALPLYTKAFSADTRYIWANFTVDTIKIDDYSLPEIKLAERQLIRWLVVESVSAGLYHYYRFGEVRGFRNLEEVDILVSDEISQWEGSINHFLYHMTVQYGELEDWEWPRIRIFQPETGVEMNSQKYHRAINRERG
ncbi:hypothetical protein V499_02460 [Pseudogymnoascus sp. VKM F-103]|uniref:2EXR domain-containing protein n=1 Tax=Pseudogymnoascus verrucosus TaxID=342668 RepID=A0A2P6FGR5_9PEZI|nr:uncharacterized protein VE01_10726 [Pseudogymnoascus verrucosus]KFY78382.1 hypothetical protein V499_02460 [Pseudogymnoascus sp. VKM F-103]PQM43830.1 hypothetical protein VE01_10726 [Pseudogymnoascus verrucosus]